MKRLSHVLCLLFLSWLLLLGSSQQSVGVQIGPAGYRSRFTTGHIARHLINESKTRKPPSGPNPNGNHRPPTRT